MFGCGFKLQVALPQGFGGLVSSRGLGVRFGRIRLGGLCLTLIIGLPLVGVSFANSSAPDGRDCANCDQHGTDD